MIWKYYPPIHSIGTTGYREAVRLRKVPSRSREHLVWIACSADETSPKDGDMYLSGEQCEALEAFFRKALDLESPDIEREILMENESTQ
jgi:hypothetical protein